MSAATGGAPAHRAGDNEATLVDGWLTQNARKRVAYPDDIYFREAWTDVVDVLTDPGQTLHRCAFLVIKPEAVVMRRAERILELAGHRGFRALHACRVRFERHRIRALWHYHLNCAPVATVLAVDMIATTADAVFVLVDGGSAHEQPASVRLSAAKEHLRTVLGGAAKLISWVHVPDEPADVVRELGVWFAGSQRRALIRHLDGPTDAADAVDRVIAQAYACAPACDSSLDGALHRLAAHVRTAANAQDTARLDEVRDRLREGRPLGGPRLLELVRWLADASALDAWDRALVAAHLVEHEPPTGEPLL